MKFTVGFDVGGTNIVSGIVNEQGELVHKIKRPTEASKGSEYVCRKMSSMMDDLLAEANVSRDAILAVGVGTPGFVDPERGVSVFAGNLKFKDVPLADNLRALTGKPVSVDNDVRMYIYGEASSGAAKGFDHVLGITLGTGMAAAVVNKGELYYGGAFMAGELGHIRMDGVNYACGCGMTGCLETVASATGIARQAKELIAQGKNSILKQWFPTEEEVAALTAADVSRAYDKGDEVAIQVMERTGKLLGTGLSYAVTLFSPDVVVIGGGAAQAGERLFRPMREQLQQMLFSGYWDRLTIVPAKLMDDAGVIGSAMYARYRNSN